MKETQQRWRSVTPLDVVHGRYCRLNVQGSEPTPTMYRMCGYYKYGTDPMVVYVERNDGSRTFFNEGNLEVLDERHLSQ